MGFFLVLFCAESEGKKKCEGDNCVLNIAAKEKIVNFYEQLGKKCFYARK